MVSHQPAWGHGEVERLENKIGQHSSDTAQIRFEGCRIPLEQRIGAEGEGYKIALGALEGGRIGIAAQSVGMARSALDVAIGYARERHSFGRAIIEHQGDRKSNRMSTSMAHVWGVSGMHTGDCWVDFSKPVARDFSV